MNYTIDLLHYKITAKFDYLVEIGLYLKNVTNEFHKYIIAKNNELKVNSEKNIKKEEYISLNFEQTYFLIISELDKLISEIEILYIRYNDATSSIMSEYYDLIMKSDTSDDPSIKLEIKEKFDEYQQSITTKNFVNLLDHHCSTYKKLVDKINNIPEFKNFLNLNNNINLENFLIINSKFSYTEYSNSNISNNIPNDILLKLSFKETIEKFIELYDENKIVFQVKLKIINECECGSKMIMNSTTSYKVCEGCGYEIYMPGTVFDDSQFYNQQGQCSKHKKYDSNRHCDRWIKQIQATEDISGALFNEVVDKLDKRAIKEYTKDGKLRSMKNMKCKQIREWLKDYRLTTKWNDHAPLLRKAVTALHGEAVVPPQLTKEEEEDILIDFSCDMNLYEELSKQEKILQLIDKKKIKNKPYYPFGLLKVLCQKLKNDSRLMGLIECIHFQSSQTNVKNDKIYKVICEKRNKIYEPTDRTILVEIQ